MCWLKEIEICLWPLIETYLLSEFSFFTWFNFICTCVGTEREQPFKELRLSAMNYVNFGKGLRGGMWMGWGKRCRDKLWKCRIFCCSTGSTSMSGENGDDDDGRWWWWWSIMVMAMVMAMVMVVVMVDYGGEWFLAIVLRMRFWSFVVEKMTSKLFSNIFLQGDLFWQYLIQFQWVWGTRVQFFLI